MLGFNQKNFNSTSRVTAAAVNLGSTRGIGSTTRIFNFCVARTGNPQFCLSQIFSIPPSPQLLYIYSKNITTRGCFDIGDNLIKDMFNDEFQTIYSEVLQKLFSDAGIPRPVNETEPVEYTNIVQGDKSTADRIICSKWSDWGGDVFDGYGNFFFYDVLSEQYYFPLISPQNQPNGKLFSQTFNVFDKSFSMIQGFPVRGIFKFDISVNDPNYLFRFGMYGNFGSDSNSAANILTHPYSLNGKQLTLYYLYHRDSTKDTETVYIYFIPKLISQNNSQTFFAEDILEENSDENLSVSVPVSYGVIVYISRGNDVRDWVINDLGIN